jgi:hypothetical protein
VIFKRVFVVIFKRVFGIRRLYMYHLEERNICYNSVYGFTVVLMALGGGVKEKGREITLYDSAVVLMGLGEESWKGGGVKERGRRMKL